MFQIALSQLSRVVKNNVKTRERSCDIRESGSLLQDADIVAFLYREMTTMNGGEKEEGIPNNKVRIIISKNRSGARGTVELIFPKEYNINSQVSQRGRHKMSDAYREVEDEKKIKENQGTREGSRRKMLLENGRTHQKKRLGKLIEVYPSIYCGEFGDVEGDKQVNVYVESFTYSDILTEKNLIHS